MTNASGDLAFTIWARDPHVEGEGVGLQAFERTDMELTALATLDAGELKLQVGKVIETVED